MTTCEILVRRKGTNQIVKRVPVSSPSLRRIAKAVRGMEINMGADYFVDDDPAYKALAELAAESEKVTK